METEPSVPGPTTQHEAEVKSSDEKQETPQTLQLSGETSEAADEPKGEKYEYI